MSEHPNYPSRDQHLAWYAEWQAVTAPRMFSLEQYGHYLAQKCCDWQRERDAAACDALRVKGGDEWGLDHLVAVKALTDASAAIRGNQHLVVDKTIGHNNAGNT